jgi:hypothetical protein
MLLYNTLRFLHITLLPDVRRTEGQLYQNPKFNFEKSVEVPRSSLRPTVEEKGQSDTAVDVNKRVPSGT